MVAKHSDEKHIFKIINNVPSHLITWENPFDCNGQDVIVCITGNPGITDFYIEFGSQLHEQTSLPVCIIGQAGHENFPDQSSNTSQDIEEPFKLKGQIEHKLDLIKNHIDKKSRLHLIGHSIGAWMAIELMDKNNFLKERVSSTNLLFPTVQKMADSKNGIFLNKTIRPLNRIIQFLCFFITLLPAFVVNFFVKCYIKFHGFPDYYSERIHKFLHPKSVEKVLLLAYDEMDSVTTLNEEGVRKLDPNTNIIYSVRDNWAPVHYIDDLKAIQPSLVMTKVNISHAFVLKSSKRVACMVAEFIKSNIFKK